MLSEISCHLLFFFFKRYFLVYIAFLILRWRVLQLGSFDPNWPFLLHNGLFLNGIHVLAGQFPLLPGQSCACLDTSGRRWMWQFEVSFWLDKQSDGHWPLAADASWLVQPVGSFRSVPTWFRVRSLDATQHWLKVAGLTDPRKCPSYLSRTAPATQPVPQRHICPQIPNYFSQRGRFSHS